ncbi:MAG: hypothetical protein WC693_04650 [Patescibacteria group bacterium]|jgi:hypothetical protein
MHSNQLAGQKPKASTQSHLDILEIKDNVVAMKDGTLRAIILVSSINFALKSEDEQVAVIQGYTQFLNSFDFSIQIVIQSRKLNIEEYLDRLKKVEKEQSNELLRMQTAEYQQYIKELVEIADIMSKRFYVIVPYSPISDKQKKYFARLKEVLSPTSVIHLKRKKFDKYRTELFKRVDYVTDGLSSIGLKSVQLDTQSIIELFYNTYNPEVFSQEQLVDLDKLQVEEDSSSMEEDDKK